MQSKAELHPANEFQ